MNWMRVFFRI